MYFGDYFGTGSVQDLIAAFEPFEIIQVQIESLQHGAHRPVGHQDAVEQMVTKASRHVH